jgi:hypothetical protein
MSLITVYDAINTKVDNIPLNAPGIAYYKYGTYAWTAAQIAKFPLARKISITPSAAFDADVLDVENGDATPEDVPGWLDRNPANKGLYCNLSTWPEVQSAVGLQKAKYWIAAPGPAIPIPGALARQYGYLGIYDVSIFDSAWWDIPVTAPSLKDGEMVLANDGKAQFIVYSTDNGLRKSVCPPGSEIQSVASASGNWGTCPILLASIPSL